MRRELKVTDAVLKKLIKRREEVRKITYEEGNDMKEEERRSRMRNISHLSSLTSVNFKYIYLNE